MKKSFCFCGTFIEVLTLICFFLSIFSSLTANAQILGGYKYVHICGISEDVRDYKWINSMANMFAEKGCRTLQPYEIDALDYRERSHLLFADFNTVEWRVTFYDYNTGAHVCEIPIGGSSGKKFLREVHKALESWDNQFNSELPKPIILPFSSWTEDRIKEYLQQKPVESLEGIYKNYESDGSERIAIFEFSGSFYAITLDNINRLNHFESLYKGDIRVILNNVEDNVYDAKFINRKIEPYSTFDLLAEYKGRLLSIANNERSYKYIKIFPQSTIPKEQNQTIPSTLIKSTGSGFVISDNIIATNYHVVKDANTIQVTFNINGIMSDFNATVIATDKTNDLALLAIKDKNFKPFKSIPYSILSKPIDVGSSVFTMGYPMTNVMGTEVKVTDGLISSKTGYEGDIVSYQISAPIQPGNSGGALFDKKGHLVGITNAGISSADNVGYAIKSSYLINLIDSAPIKISMPKGVDLSGKDLPSIIKLYSPCIAIIKIF